MDVPCSLGDMMASSPITQGGGYLLALMLDAMVMGCPVRRPKGFTFTPALLQERKFPLKTEELEHRGKRIASGGQNTPREFRGG